MSSQACSVPTDHTVNGIADVRQAACGVFLPAKLLTL